MGKKHDIHNVGQPFVEEGSVKPAKHKKGTHTFSLVMVANDLNMVEWRVLLKCLPCKVWAGVDTCRLLRFPSDTPLEEIIAGLQGVIADQDPKDICCGDVPATKKTAQIGKKVTKAVCMAKSFFEEIVYGPGMAKSSVLPRAREILAAFRGVEVL